MRSLSLVALVVGSFALAGCNREAKDFEAMCHVLERSGVSAGLDPSVRSQRIGQWIEDHIHTERARRAWRAIGQSNVSPEQKREMMRREAAEAGYNGPCPLFGSNGPAEQSGR
jgi:hypothetical protein